MGEGGGWVEVVGGWRWWVGGGGGGWEEVVVGGWRCWYHDTNSHFIMIQKAAVS